MTYKKIEVFDRVDNFSINKYVIFQNILNNNYFMFYEYKFYFPSRGLWENQSEQAMIEKLAKQEDEELLSVIEKERSFFMSELFRITPEQKHLEIFDGKYPEGFYTVKELLDSFLRMRYNKSFEKHITEQTNRLDYE